NRNAERASQERELEPARQAARECEAGCAPGGLDAELSRKPDGQEESQCDPGADPNECKAHRCARVLDGPERRCVETTKGPWQQPDPGAREDVPDKEAVVPGETAGLEQGGRDHLAKGQEDHASRDDEVADLSKAGLESLAQVRVALLHV